MDFERLSRACRAADRGLRRAGSHDDVDEPPLRLDGGQGRHRRPRASGLVARFLVRRVVPKRSRSRRRRVSSRPTGEPVLPRPERPGVDLRHRRPDRARAELACRRRRGARRRQRRGGLGRAERARSLARRWRARSALSAACASSLCASSRSGGPAVTGTLRVAMPGAPALLLLALTRAGAKPLLVTSWAIGDGRAEASKSVPVTVSSGDIIWDAKTKKSNYAEARAAAPRRGGEPGRRHRVRGRCAARDQRRDRRRHRLDRGRGERVLRAHRRLRRRPHRSRELHLRRRRGADVELARGREAARARISASSIPASPASSPRLPGTWTPPSCAAAARPTISPSRSPASLPTRSG